MMKNLLRRIYNSSIYYWCRFLSYLRIFFIKTNPPPKGYYLNLKSMLNERMGMSKNCRVVALQCEEKVERAQPKKIFGDAAAIFEGYGKDINPETYVVELPGGNVLYDYGVVLTPDERLLGDVSIEFGNSHPSQHSLLRRTNLPKRRHSDARVAVITSSAHQRYYHWMFDILPRFELLKLSGIEVDKFIINKSLPYQKETLEILDVPFDQIIEPDLEFHLQASKLIVPSLPGRSGFPTLFSCNFLRNKFWYPNCQRTLKGEVEKRIYISRLDAQIRRILNEEEVIKYLENLGFKTCTLSNMSVKDQVALFSKAECIVAPHGAALSNIVFCNPNTKIVDIFPPNYTNVCFWVLAHNMNLEYHYFRTSFAEGINLNPISNQHDMIINLNRFSKFLEPIV